MCIVILVNNATKYGLLVELAYTSDLKLDAERIVGSSPTGATIDRLSVLINLLMRELLSRIPALIYRDPAEL